MRSFGKAGCRGCLFDACQGGLELASKQLKIPRGEILARSQRPNHPPCSEQLAFLHSEGLVVKNPERVTLHLIVPVER